MFSRILIGVDGRPGGREALALAQGLAEPSARLIAAHVDREARDGSPIDARPGEALLDAELGQAGVEAERLVIGERLPGRALRDATARTGADLLVLGSSHRGQIGRIFTGETALVALHGAHCAVAVAVRGGTPPATGGGVIGVGFDGSAEARRALELAAGIARAEGGSLRVLAAGEPLQHMLPTAPGGHPWRSIEEQRRASSEAMVAAATSAPALVGVDVRTAVVPGFPGDRLERLSQEVDLLIIGSRAHGPALRTLVGSTAARLLHTAYCPVVIVPRGAAGQAAHAAAA